VSKYVLTADQEREVEREKRRKQRERKTERHEPKATAKEYHRDKSWKREF
jgi:hypothetical protein